MRELAKKISEILRNHVIALVGGALSLAAVTLTWGIEAERQTRMATAELAEIRARLESVISASSYPIEALANAVLMNKGSPASNEIQKFADGLHNLSPALLSLQLAPDAIVRISSRPDRDAKALGHDLLADDARRPEVVRAIRNRKTVFVGPVDLIQGGAAVIARKPIYVPGRESPIGMGDFYGFATAIIDADYIFESADIDRNRFALRGRHGLGADGEVIYGAPGIFNGETLNMPVSLPNGSWQLATPKPGFYDFLPELPFVALISIMLSALFVQMASRIRRRQDQAKRDAEKLRVASKVGNLGFIEQLENGSISMSPGAQRILEAESFDGLAPDMRESISKIIVGFNQATEAGDGQNILNFESASHGEKSVELSPPLASSPLNIISVRDISNVTKRIEREINLSKLASIGELAAGVAHELNTPLQYITDNLHFLRTIASGIAVDKDIAGQDGTYTISEEMARDLMEEFPSAINDCVDGTERMTRIIAAMKSYAAPDDNIPARDIDITKIIESAVVLTAGAHKHLAAITFDKTGEQHYVKGRENELTQVFINLINNSCDAIRDRFTGQNSGQKGNIQIALKKIGERLRITYKDNGGGIPVEIRRKIFDLFFTTKPVGKGTGQGLAISLAILKRYNGDIRYEPAPPDGSMFIIELALAEESPAQVAELVECG